MAISNKEFVDTFVSGGFEKAILPQEVLLIEKRLGELARQQAHLVKEKTEVTGGDDWHDGAFRATDNEAKILAEQAGNLSSQLKSTVVEHPEPTEERVTLGSRVTLDQSGDTYDVEIVGVTTLHEVEDGEDVLPCSIESPIARGVIGKKMGEIAIVNIGGHRQEIRIVKVDQDSMQRFLTDELAK